LAISVAILGGSAGLFEECARYIVMRWRPARFARWESAIGFGLGHGGIEAVLLAAASAIYAPFLLFRGDQMLSKLQALSPEKAEAFATQLAMIRGITLGSAFLPLWERSIAVLLHVALSLLVWRAVQQRRVGWLLVAILWHSAIDALAVLMVKAKWPPAQLELALTALSIFSVAAVAVSRARWRTTVAPATGQLA
jgi:uncharacterized membrane protein YhfC